MAFWKSSSSSLTISTEIIDGFTCAKISRGEGDKSDWSLIYTGRDIEFAANNEYQISFIIKPITPKMLPFNVGFWVDEGAGYQTALKLQTDTIENGWLNVKAKYTFKKNYGNLIFPINSQESNSSFYITNISLTNLTQKQLQSQPRIYPQSSALDTTGKSYFFSDRSLRWKYAVQLWENNYKWYNKLFGHGFDYYELFGQRFLKDKTKNDYPHNPFLSVLLYSGLIGFFFFIWLLYRASILYLRYRKDYGILFICFLITFFFSFFSGSSPFDPPIMGFFILLPFYIHLINENKVD